MSKRSADSTVWLTCPSCQSPGDSFDSSESVNNDNSVAMLFQLVLASDGDASCVFHQPSRRCVSQMSRARTAHSTCRHVVAIDHGKHVSSRRPRPPAPEVAEWGRPRRNRSRQTCVIPMPASASSGSCRAGPPASAILCCSGWGYPRPVTPQHFSFFSKKAQADRNECAAPATAAVRSSLRLGGICSQATSSQRPPNSGTHQQLAD